MILDRRLTGGGAIPYAAVTPVLGVLDERRTMRQTLTLVLAALLVAPLSGQ